MCRIDSNDGFHFPVCMEDMTSTLTKNKKQKQMSRIQYRYVCIFSFLSLLPWLAFRCSLLRHFLSPFNINQSFFTSLLNTINNVLYNS